MQTSPVVFLFRLSLFIGILFLVDLYAYQAVKAAVVNFAWARPIRTAWWVFHALFYAYIIVFFSGFLLGWRANPQYINYSFTLFIVFYLPKLFILLVLFLEDAVRGGKWLLGKLAGLFSTAPAGASAGELISRKQFLNQAALVLGGIPLGALLYGALKGKYQYVVRRVRVAVRDLPDAFQGFRITQLSDLHTGSLTDMEEVKRGIRMANEQGSDLIVFTGDLVNNRSDEVGEYESVFSTLASTHGVYSVLGNHDYGDYVRDWKPGEKEKNFQDLLDTQRRMGWKLLKNEHVVIEKEGQKFALIGVENWGSRVGFPKYGKLDEAMKGTEGIPVKVLLSHDPSHWDAEVRKKYPEVQLTLSGHTHGFQLGIEIPGFRWSPVQYVYRQWAGLYSEGGQHLYVNRGFGFIGYAGRVGIKPEITVIELVKA